MALTVYHYDSKSTSISHVQPRHWCINTILQQCTIKKHKLKQKWTVRCTEIFLQYNMTENNARKNVSLKMFVRPKMWFTFSGTSLTVISSLKSSLHLLSINYVLPVNGVVIQYIPP